MSETGTSQANTRYLIYLKYTYIMHKTLAVQLKKFIILYITILDNFKQILQFFI